ncbi:MAG: acyl-CoA thioesterase [Candidatus Brocadiae bacterium]|nr:acyl-CoA thioesterase [Candidatus Brocadiia bacterium]
MPESFRFSTEIRVRLPETDAMGIVFHGAFFTYLEVGRMDYLRNLGLAGSHAQPIRDFANVVARACCDFRSPAHFDDPLIVHARIAEIRRTSFRFDFLIVHKQEARVVAEGHTVHVAIDPGTGRPIPVPENFRERIRRFEGAALKDPA